MNTKYIKRQRRAKHTQAHIKELGRETGVVRLKIDRTPRHIYAQLIDPSNGNIVACASSLEADIRGKKAEDGKKGVAKVVGGLIAERAKKAGIERAACDRSGFKFHGRIAALVDAARENGLVV